MIISSEIVGSVNNYLSFSSKNWIIEDCHLDMIWRLNLFFCAFSPRLCDAKSDVVGCSVIPVVLHLINLKITTFLIQLIHQNLDRFLIELVFWEVIFITAFFRIPCCHSMHIQNGRELWNCLYVDLLGYLNGKDTSNSCLNLVIGWGGEKVLIVVWTSRNIL